MTDRQGLLTQSTSQSENAEEAKVGQTTRRCATCDDDGWVEVWDDDGMEILATHDCPHIDDPWHKPFNATGVLAHEDTPRSVRTCRGYDIWTDHAPIGLEAGESCPACAAQAQVHKNEPS